MTRSSVKNSLAAAVLLVAFGCADDAAPSDDQAAVTDDDSAESAVLDQIAPGGGGRMPFPRRDGGVRPSFPGLPGAGQTPTPSEPDPIAPPPDGPNTTPVDPGSNASSGPRLAPVTNVDAPGPYEVVIEQSAGPNRGWIARPKNLGENGLKHPVFSWGCGGGSQPSQYKDHLTRWASHGFVAEAHVSTGNLADHKVVLDWVESENARSGSPYFGKLDTTKIAAGGHSMGSIATFAIAKDPRLTTTIHVAGGSFDGNGYKQWVKPTAIIAGANDNLATGNATRDWERATVPVWFTVMTGVDHIQAARAGLGPIVGWLRWWLAGETERKAEFIGPNCGAFCTGKYKTQSKNWD